MLLADLLFFAGRRYFERYYGITLAEATVFGILRRYGLNRFPGRVGRRSITMYRSAQHVPGHHVSISRSLGKDGKPIRRYQYTAGGLGVVSGSSATDSFHLGPVGYRRRYYILRSHCPEVTGALNQNTFPIVPPNLSRERGSASRGSFLLLKILPRSLYPIYKKKRKRLEEEILIRELEKEKHFLDADERVSKRRDLPTVGLLVGSSHERRHN